MNWIGRRLGLRAGEDTMAKIGSVRALHNRIISVLLPTYDCKIRMANEIRHTRTQGPISGLYAEQLTAIWTNAPTLAAVCITQLV